MGIKFNGMCCGRNWFLDSITGVIPTSSPTPDPLPLRFTFSDLDGFPFDHTSPAAWNAAFAAYVDGVTSVEVTDLGGSIQIDLFGMSGVELGALMWSANLTKPLTMIDTALSVVRIDRTFYNCSNFNTCTADACVYIRDFRGTAMGDAVFPACDFLYPQSFMNVVTLQMASFMALTSQVIPIQCFYGCTGLSSFSYSPDNTYGFGAQAFYGCTSLPEISSEDGVHVFSNAMQNCTALTYIDIHGIDGTSGTATHLGASAGDNNVFNGITGNTITVVANTYLQTNNAGGMDGDLAYLNANNTVTFIWV